jgi:hypothetical protein
MGSYAAYLGRASKIQKTFTTLRVSQFGIHEEQKLVELSMIH